MLDDNSPYNCINVTKASMLRIPNGTICPLYPPQAHTCTRDKEKKKRLQGQKWCYPGRHVFDGVEGISESSKQERTGSMMRELESVKKEGRRKREYCSRSVLYPFCFLLSLSFHCPPTYKRIGMRGRTVEKNRVEQLLGMSSGEEYLPVLGDSFHMYVNEEVNDVTNGRHFNFSSYLP